MTLGSKSWSIDESRIIGLVEDDVILDQTTGVILTDGILTQNDWSAVSDASTLTPGATYFLGAGYGSITANVPTTGYLTKIGTAISTTTLEVSITSPIKL